MLNVGDKRWEYMKGDKPYRKKLLKLLKSGDYDFIKVNKGMIVDGIVQSNRLVPSVAKNLIKFNPITDVKSLIVVKR